MVIAAGRLRSPSSNSNSTKAPKQSAEELMAEAMRHYVDLETEKKEKDEIEARERQAH